MGIAIKGVDNLISKLNKLSTIETKEIVEDLSIYLLKALKDQAATFSDDAYKYLEVSDKRIYKNSCYYDIGITSNNWEQCKSLYFQNYGYNNWGYKGVFGGMHISKNVGWFNRAIATNEKYILKTLQAKYRQEIKAFKA